MKFKKMKWNVENKAEFLRKCRKIEENTAEFNKIKRNMRKKQNLRKFRKIEENTSDFNKIKRNLRE